MNSQVLNETGESSATNTDYTVLVQDKPKKRPSFAFPESTAEPVQSAATRLDDLKTRIKTLEKEKQEWIELYESRKKELGEVKRSVPENHDDLEFILNMPDYTQLLKEIHDVQMKAALVLARHQDILESSQKLVAAATLRQTLSKIEFILNVKHQI